jgi:hypothetical protein
MDVNDRNRCSHPDRHRGGSDEAQPGLYSHRQSRRVDAGLLRQSGHSYAEHRPSRGRRDAFHASVCLQPRVLTDAGVTLDRSDPLPARRPLLSRQPVHDGPEGLQHVGRVPHPAQDPRRERIRVRSDGQVAPGGQSSSAGKLQLLDHHDPRQYVGVLRLTGDRERQGTQGAEVRHRPVDRACRPLHPPEPGPTVLSLPVVQWAVRFGTVAAESRTQPASCVLRGQTVTIRGCSTTSNS